MRGGVFKRPSGNWSYTVCLGRDAATGKKRYKQVGGFLTKRACEDALREVVDRVRTSAYTDPGSTTVAAFIERWLAAVAPTVRETTAASYRNMLEGRVLPRLGELRLARVTGLELSSPWRSELGLGPSAGGLAPSVPNPVSNPVNLVPVTAMPDDNPVAWVKTFGANDGRVFYTNLGHSMATWQRAVFQGHLLAGIEWIAEQRPDRACTAERFGS